MKTIGRRHTSDRRAIDKPRIAGFVPSGFEEVRAEFERDFTERGEIGAAVNRAIARLEAGAHALKRQRTLLAISSPPPTEGTYDIG